MGSPAAPGTIYTSHQHQGYCRNTSRPESASCPAGPWRGRRSSLGIREDENKAKIGQPPGPRSTKREETFVQERGELGVMQHTSQQGIIALGLVNYWLHVSPRKGSSLQKTGRWANTRSSCISMPLTCSLQVPQVQGPRRCRYKTGYILASTC